MTPLAAFIIYVIGFFVSLVLWSIFGKKYWIDYDTEKTYADHDDWQSNAEAYAAFSLGWPIAAVVVTLRLCWRGLVCLSRYLILKLSA